MKSTFFESADENLSNQRNLLPCTRDEFLSAIFGEDRDDAAPFVLDFPGDPKRWKQWGGALWDGNNAGGNAVHNGFFTLARFGPDETGATKRQKAYFQDAAGVYLDDIGTKAAPLERLESLPPSYLIETSEGNYQAGYLFPSPVSALKELTALIDALADAGLTDKGAKGPEARWGRMPFSLNGKPDKNFPVDLVQFHPERRYTIEQIYLGLELEPPKEKQKRRKAQRINTHADGEDVFQHRPDENPVVAALKERDLYQRPLGDGKHQITCPWHHEHTDGDAGGTVYYEPDASFPMGGFKCQHGHCEGRRVGNLLAFLEISATAAKHRHLIRVAPGELHRVCDSAEYVLAETRRYYQRGGIVSSVGTDPSTNATTIRALKQPGLARALSSAASWERYDSKNECYVPTDPPARHVASLYDAEDYRHLPPLSGLAWQPFLRPDGSVCRRAGYDAPTGLFATFDARQFSIKDSPTRQEAQDAATLLWNLLDEVEVASPSDKSAIIAALLTAAIRPSLPTAPWFHFSAPVISSGKSYLTDLACAFASEQTPSAQAFPANEEEARKLMLSALLTGPAVMRFDNLSGDILPFKTLCSVVTDPQLTDRILGVSKTATVGTRTLLLSSGNNVGPVGDMSRRVVTIRLAPTCETPATREYRRDPLAEVRRERGRYVSAALTIIRGYLASGEKVDAKPLNSFAQWTEWVRRPLIWLGFTDPAASVFAGMIADPQREEIARLFHAWWMVFQNTPIPTRRLVQAAESESADADLREAVFDIAGERGTINRRRLGKWLSRHIDRIVDGMVLRTDDGTRSAQSWQLVLVSSVSSVSDGPNKKGENKKYCIRCGGEGCSYCEGVAS